MQEQVMMSPPTPSGDFKEAMNLLVKAWSETQPTPVRDLRGYVTGWKYGSKSLTKLLEFKENSLLNNAIIQQFYNMPIWREKGEEIAAYKLRRKFTQTLIKHRERVYNYTEFDDMKRAREARKIMQKVINQTS